jgi:hypothetical protein
MIPAGTRLRGGSEWPVRRIMLALLHAYMFGASTRDIGSNGTRRDERGKINAARMSRDETLIKMQGPWADLSSQTEVKREHHSLSLRIRWFRPVRLLVRLQCVTNL